MSEHNEEIIFRSDDIERQKIAAHNKEAAERILQKAGITPDNSEYQRYLALTESNVNSAGRYALFDEGVEKMFVETLKDPEMTLSQYETATKQYRIKAIEAQQTKADGGTFSDKDGNYKALREPYDETLKSGVAMRQENQITFPKEFYDENGLPNKRLVVELDANSAWTVVNDYAEKHSDIGLSFNGEMYGINGQLQSPGKFFESRASKLNNFLKAVNKSPEGLDLSDKELMDLVYKKDYEGIVELNKTRGMARDDRNKALRNLLKQDKDLFKEVGALMLEADGDAEAFTKNVSQLSQKMKGNADLFHIETETGKFHAPKAEIDRVVFSVRPSDLAQQSTFQDWKSCMNAVGRYHSYVDDTIGQGSIIAYGYSSQNPQKMVSRVLINPYRNEKGETVYRPNNTLYGENNAVFRNAVGAVVEDKFNDVKESGIYHQAPGLYNDGDPYDILKVKKGEKCVDLSAYRGKSFYEADLSGVEKVILADGMVLDNVILPKDVSFGEKVVLKNTVLSDVDALGKVVLGEGVVLRNTVLPEGFKVPDNLTLDRVKLATDMSFGKNVSLRNMALPAGYKVPDGVILDNVTLPKDVTFGKDVILKNMTLPAGYKVPDGVILDNVILPKDVTFGKNVTLKNITLEGIDVPSDVTFKENVTFKNMTLPAGYKVPDGVTLDGLKLSPDVSFENKVTLKNMTLPEGLKVPDKAVLDNVTLASNMTFGKRVSLKNMRIPEGYKVPDEVILVNATLPQEVAFGKKVTFRGVNFASGGKVAFDDFSSSFKLDLSECSSVTFRGKEADLSNVKLPSGDKVHFQVDKVSLASVDDWNKLASNEATGVKTIIVDEVPPKGAILSKNVSIYCGHSDLLILPQGKNLKSFAEEMFAGEADLSMKDEFLKTKGKRLKVYSAAEYSGEVTGEKAALKTMSQNAEARFNKKVTEAQFNKRVAEHTAEKAAAKEAERISTVKGLRKQAMDAGEKVLTVAKKGNS
ncbi:MAG: hypothetical protein J6J35_04140, partial [Alphaproteobacteria bacterium]|nr:hypothetical protein [Alphaproteobacteria bacterium]